MPDPPIFPRRQPVAQPPRAKQTTGPAYAELRCQSNFSFLRAASHPDELVCRAAELGYAALAITDQNSLAGIVRAHVAAKEAGLPLLVGAELTLQDAPAVVVWATDKASYGRLCRLLTLGLGRAEKGTCDLCFNDLASHANGLLAGVALEEPVADPPALARFRELLGDRAYLLADAHRGGDDRARLAAFADLAKRSALPMVACGDVRYHASERRPLHDVLTAIRLGETVEAVDGAALLPNGQRHLRTREDIRQLFKHWPDALARTLEVVDRCRFSLDELRFEYPEELSPDGVTEQQWLQQLTWEGAAHRYPEGTPVKVRRQIEHELRLIAELGYEAYFLTVWDIVRFARSQDILCQGRGSAANSAVCYCLGVTSVDPSQSNLLFERFISAERNEPPDIDIDFEHERREEVLQYLYNKYGRDRAALAATVITYRVRSAIRDVGKALGLSLDRVDALSKQVDGWRTDPKLPLRIAQAGLDPESGVGKRLLLLVEQILGFPRHLSQHVGGMVVTRGALCEMVPIENAAMDDRTIVQWDKDDLEALGILKVDCLALGMLTAIRKSFALIERHTGKRWTLATLPAEDPRVYDMICQADTLGVFQIESRAQMSMLPRLRPRRFYDLVIEVAIVRPGPIQGDMVHPYLKRRRGDEAVTYPNKAIEQVLSRTLGVPIFQEQAMKLAQVAAGFTAGEADELRRAMAAWRSPGKIEHYRRRLLDGMRANGLSAEFAERCYKQLQGFGEYGFPESHAASFALLVYASCWIKKHHPAAFCAALLNSQPLGFYSPSQLVRDAQEHRVEVRPVDVNHSDVDCTLEMTDGGFALRLGLRMVASLQSEAANRVVTRRSAGAYRSLGDFHRRTSLAKRDSEALARADAFGSLGANRRQSLWQVMGQERNAAAQPLLAGLVDEEPFANALPSSAPEEEVFDDYQSLGLSLRGHPIGFEREHLNQRGVLPASELQSRPNGAIVQVAGIVLLRQRPGTAKGITFVTLEDETGSANLIIHPGTWERYYNTAKRCPAWVVRGELQHSPEGILHVVVMRIAPLSEFGSMERIRSLSRDFR